MLIDKIGNKERVFLDTMAVIYFIEKHSTYVSQLLPVFELVSRGVIAGLSSYITLLEVLVQPIRLNRLDLATQYKDILTRSPNFTLFPVEESVAEKGAEIRAQYNFRAPDVIQLATAELRGAECFITNDSALKQFSSVEVLVLDDFVQTTP